MLSSKLLSLKTRILVTGLAMMLVSIGVLSGIAMRTLRSDMERVLGEQQLATVSLVADQIETDFKLRFEALHSIAMGIDASTLEQPAALQRHLEERRMVPLLFNAGIFATRLDGTALAEVPLIGRVGVNYMDRDHIAAALQQGRDSVGTPVVGKRVQAPSFAITVPIRNAQGRVIGALAGATDLSKPNFLDTVIGSRYGKTGGYLIIDPMHRLFVTATANNRGLVMKPLPALGVNAVLDRRLQGFDGHAVNVSSLGVEVLTASGRIPSAVWFVISTLPTAEAFLPVSGMEQSLLWAAMAVMLLALPLAWWLLQRLLSPLTAAATELADLNVAKTTPRALTVSTRDEVGTLIAGFNGMLEISAQREAQLRKSEERFRRFFSQNSSVLLLIDPSNGAIVDANDAAVGFYGYSREQLLSMPIGGINMLSAERNAQEMRHARTDPAAIFNFQHRLVSGAIREVEVHSTPIESDGRGLLLSIVHDVTDRVVAERRLHQSEANIRSGMESAADAIFVTDVAGRCLYVNAQATRTLGYSREELLGMTVDALPPPPDQPGFKAQYAELVATGSLRFEARLARKDGTTLFVDANGSALPDGRVVAVLRDISAGKQADAELKLYRDHLEALVQARTADLSLAKEAAEAANRAKSTFLATMSHELRTPMNAIMGMTALARMRATDPKQIDQLGKVDVAARHLLAIITDVLDISRIEANKLQLLETDFSLGQTMQSVETLVRSEADARRIGLVFDLAPEFLAMRLRGDALRLEQVLVNLVGNGVKFTDAGSVNVSGRLVLDHGDELVLRFEVRDSGVGIAAADQRRLFRAFEQVDGSITRRHGGTGLGLAICKQLVEKMGGEIGVESQPGIGSSFWFTVRLRKAGAMTDARVASRALSAQRQLQDRHAGAHILVAEDDPLNQEVSRGVLEAAGLVVQMAADGERAVAMARRVNYDLVLMDMRMPVMDGLEATRQIRALSKSPRIPIVALTANVSAEDAARCHQAGMDDFIPRPVAAAALLAIVLKWLDRQRPAAADPITRP